MQVDKDLKKVVTYLKACIGIEFEPYHRGNRVHLLFLQTFQKCLFYLRNIRFGLTQVMVDVDLAIQVDLLGIKLREELKLGHLCHSHRCRYDEEYQCRQ